jgi:hypothetical protein
VAPTPRKGPPSRVARSGHNRDREFDRFVLVCAKIEYVAPSACRSERDRLFLEIEEALRTATPRSGDNLPPDDTFAFILAAIVTAHGFYASAAARDEQRTARADHDWYRKERARLEKQAAEIAAHPLIRGFNPDAVEFYDVDDFRCPHGRYRRTCESIRQRLEAVGMWARLQSELAELAALSKRPLAMLEQQLQSQP